MSMKIPGPASRHPAGLRRSLRLLGFSLILGGSISAHGLAQVPGGPPRVRQPGAQAPSPAPRTLGSAERKEVVENIATAATARYADAAAGARLARHLRQRFAAGAYDGYSDPVEFAAAITSDMRAAVQDVHLRAVYEPNRAAPAMVVRPPEGANAGQGSAPAGPRSFDRIDARGNEQIARTNYGFDKAERLAGNVGYLKIGQFVPLDLSAKTAVAAMDFLSNSDAMIVDLRGNPGGSPDLVRQLISYFTGPEPVQLMATYNRAADANDTMMSLAEVPGRRMTGKPLYVLIDGRTASAAEMFAYFAQRQKLATLVGETSAGAGNGGNNVPVGSGIAFFLPSRRITDGPGWEQTGVTPDVRTASEQALGAAHRAVLERLSAEAEDPVIKRERDFALELVLAGEAPGAIAEELGDYAGRFGTRAFRVEGGRLLMVPSAGRPQSLTRTAPDIFRTNAARYTFERDAAGAIVAVRFETLDGTSSRIEKSPV